MGRIFNIQKFCTGDGSGIRTTVFLKGCPLSCAWCHNPESPLYDLQASFNKEKCINCGKCAFRCENGCHTFIDGTHFFDRQNCKACSKCAHPTCPAMKIYGYDISANDIILEVIKDLEFFNNSGGGITLSGGEPFFQPNFTLEILKKAKEYGLHTCVETSGFCSRTALKKTAKYIDQYLFDYKETDTKKHKKFTGKDNKKILENLKYLDQIKKEIILRCPIIPNFNDNKNHIDGIIQIVNSLESVIKVEIIPYHDLGIEKYSHLDMSMESAVKTLKPTAKEEIKAVVDYIKMHTTKPVSMS